MFECVSVVRKDVSRVELVKDDRYPLGITIRGELFCTKLSEFYLCILYKEPFILPS